MKSDDDIIFSKPNHVAKLSAQLSNPINSLNKKHNLANLAKNDISAKSKNLAKIKNLAKLTAKRANPAYVEVIERSAKFPIDELQRRVLSKLRKRYSVEAYKDLVINLEHIPIFDKLNWLKEMDIKLRNEYK
tara:strand:+ start:48 stop:443 length:396 start_codon:yes stop_codon:yes gene_type:complete